MLSFSLAFTDSRTEELEQFTSRMWHLSSHPSCLFPLERCMCTKVLKECKLIIYLFFTFSYVQQAVQPLWPKQRIMDTLRTELLLCMDNWAVLEAGCTSCSDTGSASSAVHFWLQQMEELSHWTERHCCREYWLDRRHSWNLGLSFKQFFRIQPHIFK